MISVLIAEDQALLRGALRELIARDPEITVVAECSRGDEVLGAALNTSPNVALLDIEMPGLHGLDALSLLTRTLPAVKVLMLTVFGRPGYLRRAMDNGARGFILKDASPARLIDAIHRTARGERVIDADLAVAALEAGVCPLTVRERELLALSRSLPGTAELAAHVHLSEGTVRNHLSLAMQKLHAQSRAEAARIAEDNGWF